MRRRIAASAVAAGVLAATVAVSCDANGNDRVQPASNAPAHCTVLADGPRRDREPPRAMVVRVRFRCTRPGAEVLMLAVRLERAQNSTWRIIRAQTYAVRGADTRVRGAAYRSRQLTARCMPGRYRTSVEWTRVSRGVTSSGRARSAEVADPCAVTPVP